MAWNFNFSYNESGYYFFSKDIFTILILSIHLHEGFFQLVFY